jgi:hypothetical protein
MNPDALYSRLGHFVLTFQAIEAAMVELIILLTRSDPEYVATLTAELEFTAKARALDVIFTRFAHIHRLSNHSPDPKFHSLAVRIQRLATRRNDLVHSFYRLLITIDGDVALERSPTKLKPSDGLRKQSTEDIHPEKIEADTFEMKRILVELEEFRLAAIDALYPK